jgi:hypothetical protein
MDGVVGVAGCARAADCLEVTLLRDAEQLGLKFKWHVSNFIEEPCERRKVHHESTLVHGCPVNRKTSQRTGAACAKKVLRLVDRRLQAVDASAQQPTLCFS